MGNEEKKENTENTEIVDSTIDRCETCRYAVSIIRENPKGENIQVIECHRSSPGLSRAAAVVPVMPKASEIVAAMKGTQQMPKLQLLFLTSWVEVSREDWCGEYESENGEESDLL